ncbi:glycosyltransferase family 4 protein [Candidatus Njordibacter sp. Uisw_002]|uniref:glycosyltransferase family 4 protein n=1 Tax=Candidatus Njordibacter sp. Uisw_002 TaxID=3230971 RepID=UPI003D5541B6
MPRITIGIDAVNIRAGGGVTHLVNLISAFNIEGSNVGRVVIWSSRATAEKLPERPWLEKKWLPWMDSNFLFRIWGYLFNFPGVISSENPDVVFSPGGTLPKMNSVPGVTMSQNMLPFEASESFLFGRFSLMRLKMWILRFVQGNSFRRAQGVIFLTEYARTNVIKALNSIKAETVLIPHGIEPRFFKPARIHRRFDDFCSKRPLKIIYVSMFMPYKHQKEVMEAVWRLSNNGLPVEIEFIGTSDGRYGRSCKRLLNSLDPDGKVLKMTGYIAFDDLHALYSSADLLVFASSCENLPNILIEGMASQLPIVCSEKGPMPEVLKAAGCYFNPYNSASISAAILRIISDIELQETLATNAYKLAESYCWSKCADDTFGFLTKISQGKNYNGV